jgi:hypothetical protein
VITLSFTPNFFFACSLTLLSLRLAALYSIYRDFR